jgi:hypothetical protein
MTKHEQAGLQGSGAPSSEAAAPDLRNVLGVSMSDELDKNIAELRRDGRFKMAANLEFWKMKFAERTLAEMPAGQVIADEILKRIALRYRKCSVNIYPDLPELTPVEGVLRCAMEEGFVLTQRTLAEMPPAAPPSDLLQRLEVYAVHWDKGHRAVFWEDIEREVRK